MTGTTSKLTFDIDSWLKASIKVEFDIDTLSFDASSSIEGAPFELENVQLVGELAAKITARAGARLTVSVNGQPLHTDLALGLGMTMAMETGTNAGMPVRVCSAQIHLLVQSHCHSHCCPSRTRSINVQTVFEGEHRSQGRHRRKGIAGKPGQYHRQSE